MELIERTQHWLRQESGALLTELDYDGFGHSIGADELEDISNFMIGAISVLTEERPAL